MRTLFARVAFLALWALCSLVALRTRSTLAASHAHRVRRHRTAVRVRYNRTSPHVLPVRPSRYARPPAAARLRRARTRQIILLHYALHTLARSTRRTLAARRALRAGYANRCRLLAAAVSVNNLRLAPHVLPVSPRRSVRAPAAARKRRTRSRKVVQHVNALHAHAVLAVLPVLAVRARRASGSRGSLVALELAPRVFSRVAALRGRTLVHGYSYVLRRRLRHLVHTPAVRIVRILYPSVCRLSVRTLGARHTLLTLYLAPLVITRHIALRRRLLVVRKADVRLARRVVRYSAPALIVRIANPCVQRLAVRTRRTLHSLRTALALRAALTLRTLFALRARRAGGSRGSLVALRALVALAHAQLPVVAPTGLFRRTLRRYANPSAATVAYLVVITVCLAALPVAAHQHLRELHAPAHPPEHVAPERHLPRRQYEQTLLRRKLVAHHARVSLNARRVLPARREDNQRRAVLVPLVAAQTETHLNYLVPRRRLAVRNARVVIRLRKHHVVLANLRHQTPVILALHAFIRALGNIKFLAARLVARFPEVLHLVPLVRGKQALPTAANLFHSRYLITRLAQHYVAAHVAQLPYLEL